MLKAHIEQCPDHPMSALKKQLEHARVALATIVSTPFVLVTPNDVTEFQQAAAHITMLQHMAFKALGRLL
jgi:hypothetical protein